MPIEQTRCYRNRRIRACMDLLCLCEAGLFDGCCRCHPSGGAGFYDKGLHVLQRGSGKIKEGVKVESEFQSMATHSLLFSRMGLQQADERQIQNGVVIPFDAILQLIPSWKAG